MKTLLILLSLGFAGCFDVDEPPCAYSCGPNKECPDDYQCGADNYCHLHGTGVCFFSDAAINADLSVVDSDFTDLPLNQTDL